MTALLCADIGNSHTTLGLLRDGEVLDHWRVATDERGIHWQLPLPVVPMARRTLRGEDRLAIEHAAATRRQPLTARRGIHIAGGDNRRRRDMANSIALGIVALGAGTARRQQRDANADACEDSQGGHVAP